MDHRLKQPASGLFCETIDAQKRNKVGCLPDCDWRAVSIEINDDRNFPLTGAGKEQEEQYRNGG
ncbi:MAG TPA: hypothetical protein VKN18_05995 [Blastocatellia bacterium]|nr:hypothetical protein [Blastocatellia bacterium]